MAARSLLVCALLGGFACARDTSAPVPSPVKGPTVSRLDADAAETIFAQRCTPCHGSTGGGDGPASAGLSPHPRNFHDKTWQASVTDKHIEQIVQYGGSAVGKSPNMPPNPDLQAKAGVVSALTHKIRAFGE